MTNPDPPAAGPPTTATTAALWKQRYEALRQWAGAAPRILEAEPMGALLLCRQGVAGWMRSWSGLTGLCERPPAAAARAAPAPDTPGSQWQQQLTQLLAQMSLVHLPKLSPL
jgi:hypothetical protein